ncbi:protein-L-isoaspartate(D-aspartate) O-methyltransferase [Saliphagus sp. LR7]|uniref:protein-L-isoaspartate(D-aspartate) O-methyltransferase n=1 Tax=Saliphagus sp. LR7 TaxID=2282654 RepID=UPI000DF7859B|nr:protein-L-isoaspartate(D-aspartate) O-methyltransferase [Saliphagus sp. LR7]
MPDYEHERDRLVDGLAGRIDDDRVVEALRRVPRHEFVPPARRDRAYVDRPLPIGDDQTISAPHMVAIMADLLELSPGESVLEIGTGCGYHAAITAEIVGAEHVASVEYSEALASEARETLADAGYGAIDVRVGDGREGWPERAPFDAVYLTCGAPEVPGALVSQLRPGGRLLAPVGSGAQTLVELRNGEDGAVERTEHGGVRFVRMRG